MSHRPVTLFHVSPAPAGSRRTPAKQAPQLPPPSGGGFFFWRATRESDRGWALAQSVSGERWTGASCSMARAAKRSTPAACPAPCSAARACAMRRRARAIIGPCGTPCRAADSTIVFKALSKSPRQRIVAGSIASHPDGGRPQRTLSRISGFLLLSNGFTNCLDGIYPYLLRLRTQNTHKLVTLR